MKRILLTTLFALLVSVPAQAIVFELFSSSAVVTLEGNPHPTLYEWDKDNGITLDNSGNIFTSSSGSTGGIPWLEIFFNGPQPYLTEVSLKAGGGGNSGGGGIVWGLSALSAFNSANYDSIRLYQDALKNPSGNAHLDISHGGINGTLESVKTPDSGTTLALLGLGLLGMIGVRRFARK